ncbi:UbiA family prenyltransferase [Microbacterium sp. LRZ72]|uniref:UbiA family prenyltransferase n=1 Tax=Microbacterium sp. LRZ72 TaxID=2942481 RepID=UPI0029AFCC77|nr:UbiA family prenyltransferase [Microbacterium sp. LRZ72]MDX2377957.1 UbiA family prenyltransferase [Microbacterium sp. LRZ72]
MTAVLALWRSCHPGPTVVVTALSALLGLAAAVPPGRIALLVAAVFVGQLSIGWSNDAIDAHRDRAVGRADKPIARGEISARTVGIAGGVALAVALGVSAALGPAFLTAHAVFLVSAWSYNAGLKRTVVSLAPFLVSFGLLPTLATLAGVPPQPAPVWAWIAGAALGAAVHLTNVLPDLDDDARTGVRGLPHRLGARASTLLAVAGLLVGAAAALLGPVGGDPRAVAPLSWLFFAAVAALAAVTVVVALTRPRGRVLFTLVMVSALLLAAQLVATGSALAA